MDFDSKFWLDLVQSVVMAGITLWMWAANRRAAQKKEVDEKLAGLNDRVTVAEQLIESGPDHSDIEKIYQRMDEISGELKQLMGEFRGVNHTLQLLHEHLLSRKE
mgnify:CR=1 FL=1